jgi:hypothetical protein
MRHTKKLGEDEHDLPRVESFRFRAAVLNRQGLMRLCERCLRGNTRCVESRRYNHRERSWKAHRRTQYKVYSHSRLV